MSSTSLLISAITSLQRNLVPETEEISGSALEMKQISADFARQRNGHYARMFERSLEREASFIRGVICERTSYDGRFNNLEFADAQQRLVPFAAKLR